MTALLLMSGGLDSAAIAMWKRPHLLTVDYGQLAADGEIRAASAIAHHLDLPHDLLRIDARAIGAGDLAGAARAEGGASSEWWPFRNQLLVTFAAAWLITHRVADSILIGVVRDDARFADGTGTFVHRLDELLHGQEGELRLDAPAVDMTTPELLAAAQMQPALASLTHSCDTGPLACGHCHGCAKRNTVYAALGWQL